MRLLRGIAVSDANFHAGYQLNPENKLSAGLRHLYVPTGCSNVGSRGSRLSIFNIGEQQTYGSATGVGGAWSGSDVATGVNPPPITASQLGLAWDFTGGGVAGQFSGAHGYDPAGAGGHSPATAFCLLEMITIPGSFRSILSLAVNTTNQQFFFGLNGASIYFAAATGVTASMTGPSLAVGGLYCIIASTRSATDHEVVVRDLTTGVITRTTSTTDFGSSGTNPSTMEFGRRATTLFLTGVRIAALGFYPARGLTSAEMTQLAYSPTSLWQRKTKRTSGDFASTILIPELHQPRIISSGYWR